MKTKKYLGHIILWILVLLPITLWFLQDLSLTRFSDLQGFVSSIAKISGLAGMALFSLVIILSSRLKILEKLFKGINGVYVNHHFMGGLAFSLLLFHPLLLALSYFLISPESAVFFLLSLEYWPRNYGKIALSIMSVALIITFYISLKYQIWKFSHKFLGLAFIFASLHIFFIGSDIAANPFLKVYFLILATLATAAFLYRAVLGKFLVKKFEYIIENVINLPDHTVEIEMTPIKKELKFLPGQFVFASFINKSISKEAHPFSISSSSNGLFKIAIKELGDYTKKIKSLEKGDKVLIEGPYGKFNFKNFSEKQIWIAGGIGIVPFLSMARSLTSKDSDYKIDMYYSAKDNNSFIFPEELIQISKSNTNFKIEFWQTDKHGFVTAEAIKKTSSKINDCDILICGPQIMMTEMKKQFLKLGVKKNRIQTEEFQLY